MRTALLLLIVVLAGTSGEIAVTHAMKRIGDVHGFAPRTVLRALGRAFRLPTMWLGVALIATGFFSMLILLSWENVSFVVPATSLSYAVGALGAKLVLGERVSRVRWMGVLLVILGVVLVWLGEGHGAG
jgi:drug/metabolite transporter (DMT)-like permease